MDTSSPLLAHMPMAAPPPGVQSNFVSPESNGKIAVAIGILCLVFMWPIFIMRLYAKIWIVRAFWYDDAAAILATIGATSYIAAVMWGCTHAWGHHAWDTPLSVLSEQFLEVTVAVYEITYQFTIFFAKLSLFLLYLRIFSCKKPVTIAAYLGIVVNALFYTGSAIYFGYGCVPPPGTTWFQAASQPRCRNVLIMDYIQGAYGIVSDLYLFILPIPVVLELQLRTRKRVGVLAVFATGLFAVIASVLGMYYRVQASSNDDISWNEVPTLSLAMIEVSVGVICSSMPHIVSIFRRYKEQFTRLSSLRNLITRRFRSHGPSKEWPSKPSSASSDGKHYVETRILGSIQGDGNFMKSRDFSTFSKTRHSFVPLRSDRFGGLATHRESAND